MTSPDFFTRLVAVNAAGPNVNAGTPEGSLEHRWICGNCDADHASRDNAVNCCPPDVYRMWKCPSCDELHQEKGQAKACCDGVGDNGQPLQCPVCMRMAESFEHAADCCLHTHPNMTAFDRQRVAQAVEGGMPWAEAIARNVHH